ATATDLELIASGNIFFHHSRGIADVKNVSAATGNVDFFSVGSIIEDDGDSDHAIDADPSALFKGNQIKIASQGAIGLAANPIEIDAATTQAALQAFGSTGIYLTELTDSLSVQQLSSANGDVVFTLAEGAGSGQSFALTSTGRLTAVHGSITLNLPDDASFPAGGQLQLANNLSISIDAGNLAGDLGASLLFDVPVIGASQATITTGPDADTLVVRQVNTPTLIRTGDGNDVVQVGSTANRLNPFKANLQINTEAGADQIAVDASGGSNLGMTGAVIASPVTGYTSRLSGFELASPLDFTGAEQVNLKLGTGADTATIEVVDDLSVLNLFAGSGNDKMIVGSAGQGVSRILGRLNTDGGIGSDSLTISDEPNTITKVGTLTERTVTGLGMGSANEGVRYDQFESLALNLGTGVNNTGSGQYQLQVPSVGTATRIRFGAGSDSVQVGNQLFNIGAPLAIDGGANPITGDQLTILSDSSTALSVDANTITGRELNGTITYAGLEGLKLRLSNSPDRIDVTDTGAALTVEARDGADEVQIATVSHPTRVNVGMDTDSDRVNILGAGAAIIVNGDSRSADTVALDLNADMAPKSVQIRDTQMADTYEVVGATQGTISVTKIADLSVILGRSGDTVELDTASVATVMGPTISDTAQSSQTPFTTTLQVNGGLGDDEFTAKSLDNVTVVRGGGNDDAITVPIAGVPNSSQFSNLRLDVEQLVVDNRANTLPIAWNLSDLSLTADPIVSGAPSGNPIVVVQTDGVGRTKILGGTGSDTLDVVTTTVTETFGEIDLDSADPNASDRVQLDFGGEVFVPGTSSTLERAELNLDFDHIAAAGRSFTVGSAKISSSGTLLTDTSTGSAAIGAGSVTDQLSLEPIGGKVLRLNALELLSKNGSSTRTIALTGTLLDGSTEVVNVTFNEGNSFATINPSAAFTKPATKITWSMATDVLIRSIDYAEQTILEFNGNSRDGKTYQESGFRISTDNRISLQAPNSRHREVLSVKESTSAQTRLRIAKDSGSFQIKSIRIKDTLREGHLTVNLTGPSFIPVQFAGASGYQNVSLTTPFNSFFDINANPSQIIVKVVVTDGTRDITIGFE
ncbi:MAG: hypothetical protein MI861_13840, partial [Pirellulales bacterium]|nr:hypothetical protein [Pirellulales bacterium]